MRSRATSLTSGTVWAGSALDVDELVLAKPVVEDTQAAGLHKTPAGICCKRSFARAAFGEKPPFDNVEGALGP